MRGHTAEEILTSKLPWWLRLDPESTLAFADNDDDEEDEDENEEEDEETDESDEDDEDSEDGDDEDDEDEEDDDDKSKSKKSKKSKAKTVPKADFDKVQAALKKERIARRRAEREARAAKKAQGATKKAAGAKKAADGKGGKEEISEADTAAELERQEREKRLAKRLRDKEVDSVITKYARELGFEDPDDAVALVNRKDIEVDQDDEDPSDVEVDEDTVKLAVKALAKKKPKLLVDKKKTRKKDDDEDDDGDDGATKTGSTFSKKSKKKEASEAELRRKYPRLRQKAAS